MNMFNACRNIAERPSSINNPCEEVPQHKIERSKAPQPPYTHLFKDKFINLFIIFLPEDLKTEFIVFQSVSFS